MALLVVGNLLGKLSHKMRTFRTGTHKTHFTAHDIPELRDLIDANLAYDATHACGSFVRFAGPDGSRLLGIDSHRSKLRKHKSSPVFAHSFLLIENGSAGVDLNQHRSQCAEWKRKKHADQSHRPMHYAAANGSQPNLPAPSREDKPGWTN